MPFPEARRVIYKRNPLDRVICQLRFPPILRIDTEIPARFQDRIRKDFPGFSEKAELALPVLQRVRKEAPVELLRQIVPTETKNYEFSSDDRIWTVNLTRTSLALTTRRYERRDEFKKRLKDPLDALVDVYQPTLFSRVGLRYIDIIRRSALNLDGVEWSELLQPYALGMLSAPGMSDHIKSLEAKVEILLKDGDSMARVVTALVDCQWKDKTEECFMIDTDFFTNERTSVPSVWEKLDYFHIRGSRLIQWLIKPPLHDAMEPETI